jgi:hypothetical protein
MSSGKPTLDRWERTRLAGQHQRTDVEWVTWGESRPLVVPRCVSCGEAWGEWGCSTRRALTLLAQAETDTQTEKRRVAELQEALSPRFGVERLQDRGNLSIRLAMQIDQHSLVYGGMGVVQATLERMGHEFAVWFQKVGDKARVAHDHIYALQLESEYYCHITQEFDAAAPYIKRPGAPWD